MRSWIEVLIALALLGVAIFFLAGCTSMGGVQDRQIGDIIRIATEADGSGCLYSRVSGNARPYADVSGSYVVVATIGKGTTYADCLNAIPPEARSLVP